MIRRSYLLYTTLLVLLLLALALPAVAADNDLKITRSGYVLPDLTVRNQENKPVRIRELLSGDQPVALNFIFTTCTTICPILTSSFRQMQRELGTDADALQIVSVSIDPEYDTPAILKAYARKVGATHNWSLITGDFNDIVQLARALNGYSSNKMDHKPIYLFKLAPDRDWVRVEGLANGADLAGVYREYLNK